MIGPDGYGHAVLQRLDGRVIVTEADDVIGISVELLAQAAGCSLWIGGDGLLWLAGDSNYRYRPVRFVSHLDGLQPDQATEGARVLVCERVQ